MRLDLADLSSPMIDFGYDVADYCDVDPRFGTLADFDDLLAQAHQRRLKILLDSCLTIRGPAPLVYREPLFARQCKTRLVYWRDPASGGAPPNNWISDFGVRLGNGRKSPAQFYYHAFLKEQPDLNWRHPKVKLAMYDVITFWFDRGVDGFRIDVLWHLLKAADFPDNPTIRLSACDGRMHRVIQIHSTDQPEVHSIAAEMRAIADSYGAAGTRRASSDRRDLFAGHRLMRYYGRERAGVHLPFNFQLIDARGRRALSQS